MRNPLIVGISHILGCMICNPYRHFFCFWFIKYDFYHYYVSFLFVLFLLHVLFWSTWVFSVYQHFFFDFYSIVNVPTGYGLRTITFEGDTEHGFLCFPYLMALFYTYVYLLSSTFILHLCDSVKSFSNFQQSFICVICLFLQICIQKNAIGFCFLQHFSFIIDLSPVVSNLYFSMFNFY